MVKNNSMVLSSNMELSGFLYKRDCRNNYYEYNDELFKELLVLSHKLGRKSKDYLIITVENDYLNRDKQLPEYIFYFKQKILNTKTNRIVSPKEISNGFAYNLKRLFNRLKPIPVDIVNNVPCSYISHSNIDCFGLFANKDIKEGLTIGVTWNLKPSNLKKTKCEYINYFKLPNVKLDGSSIVAIRDIKKDEEIFIDFKKSIRDVSR